MKIKPLCLAMLMLGLSSTATLAADGKLTFRGNIGNSSCSVTSGDEITVAMGKVPVETLEKDADGPAVGFAITLQGCKQGTYYLVLDGVSPEGQPNILALDNSTGDDVAKGVGIKISDISDKPVTLTKGLDVNNDAMVSIGGDGGSGTFYLKAHYFAFDQSSLKAGTADATATFTIVQN